MDWTYDGGEGKNRKVRDKRDKKRWKAVKDRKNRGFQHDDLGVDEEKKNSEQDEELWGGPDSYEDQYVEWD